MGGQFVRTGLGFLAIIMTARLLSVEDFGLFSIFMATIAIGTEITGKSLDWALVRFAAEHLLEARDKAYQYLKSVFQMRLVISLVFIVLGIALADFIAEDIFSKPEYSTPIAYACVGTMWMSLWWFTLSVAQTNELFPLHGAMNIANGVIKVAGVAILFFLNIKTLEPMLLTYVVVFF